MGLTDSVRIWLMSSKLLSRAVCSILPLILCQPSILESRSNIPSPASFSRNPIMSQPRLFFVSAEKKISQNLRFLSSSLNAFAIVWKLNSTYTKELLSSSLRIISSWHRLSNISSV